MTIAIDIEQFCRDPYASGIQRVLQQLALHWLSEIAADWIVPAWDGRFALLDAQRAARLLSLPFERHDTSDGNDANHVLRQGVHAELEAIARDRAIPKLTLGELIATHDAWLLPEVSYLPSVLERLDIARRTMPTTMVGYDALPMTEPANYRFVPGSGSQASEYFRLLAGVDRVVCISEWSRQQILTRLRRSTALVTTVAHPGGDHVPAAPATTRRPGPLRLLRVGTMEARKQPIEILDAFLAAVEQGLDAELIYVGNPSSSDDRINARITQAVHASDRVQWIVGATDDEVVRLIQDADWFLSYGVEGYGIPVLEAIRLGTPVLYDGIQPAGELMEGHGAALHPLEALARGALPGASAVGEEAAIPRWSTFAAEVAGVARP